MTFILTIIIIYLVWLLVKPLLMRYAQRKYQEKVNDMFNQAFGGGGRAASSTSYGPFSGQRPGEERRYQQQRYPGRKKKIFSRDEGEYVEFEEIEVEADYRSASTADPGYTPREPQVSDADWEEIR